MTRRDRHEHKPPHGSQAPADAATPDEADATAAAPAEGPAAAGPEAAGEAGAASTDSAGQYKDRWLRAEAELQNTRRRASRDRDEAVRAAEDRVLVELIEILDDVERALSALTPEQAADSWAQGVALTAQRMRDALARRGVTAIPTLGQPFDPAFHDALLEVPSAEGVAPGSVAQEVQKGYRRGERALRAARVVVARTSD